jgi:hypothetical protein
LETIETPPGSEPGFMIRTPVLSPTNFDRAMEAGSAPWTEPPMKEAMLNPVPIDQQAPSSKEGA